MDEKLTENQLDVLCVLWNQAYDFLDLCEETDHFVWPTTDLRCVPDSILHDIKVNPEDDKSRPPWEIGTEDLFLQTLDVYLRACRRATPYVGESDIFVRLLGLCDIMTETAFGEDDGKWLPDPDMIFDRMRMDTSARWRPRSSSAGSCSMRSGMTCWRYARRRVNKASSAR